MKKFLLCCVLLMAAALLCIYTVSFISTTPLVTLAREVYCGTTKVDPDDPLSRYDLSGMYSDIANAEMDITRLLVVHNGQHGYMYVVYSCRYTDRNDNILNESKMVFSKWEIVKEENTWYVTDIMEDP